jgi:hypothetical protein
MCAAVDIDGSGTAKPDGVTFPGTYEKDDPGFNFKLYDQEDLQTSEKKGYVSSIQAHTPLFRLRSCLTIFFYEIYERGILNLLELSRKKIANDNYNCKD